MKKCKLLIGMKNSIVRSYFFPVFTLRQALALLSLVGISIVAAAVSEWAYDAYIPVMVTAASLGALSTSSPAFLLTERVGAVIYDEILRAGGWEKIGNTYTRDESMLWRWENDIVEVLELGEHTLITGPRWTVRQLARAISKSQ